MSGQRVDCPVTPLCGFAFRDGRRCAMPALPAHDGLCYHGALDACDSRKDLDDVLRELASLNDGSSSATQSRLGYRVLSRAVSEGRISPHRAALLLQLNSLLQRARRCAVNDQFACGRGPHWDRLLQLLRQLNPELPQNA